MDETPEDWTDVTAEVELAAQGRGLLHRVWCAVWTSDDYRFVRDGTGNGMHDFPMLRVERRVKK
jgi:hypothetical protein